MLFYSESELSLADWKQLIEQRYAALQKEVAALTRRPITIVAVSKYCSDTQFLAAVAAGIRCFGENQAQSLANKKTLLSKAYGTQVPAIDWHFIGALQSNKVNKVVGEVRLIHSVSSLALARKLAARAKSCGLTQGILLQVNISQEANKQGYEPEKLLTEAFSISQLEGISLEGLMGMAANTKNPDILQKTFAQLPALRAKLLTNIKQALPVLSMGMSQDYLIAISQGATHIRVGSNLFKPPV